MYCDFSNRKLEGMETRMFQENCKVFYSPSVAKETYMTSAKLWAYLGRHFIVCIFQVPQITYQHFDKPLYFHYVLLYISQTNAYSLLWQTNVSA